MRICDTIKIPIKPDNSGEPPGVFDKRSLGERAFGSRRDRSGPNLIFVDQDISELDPAVFEGTGEFLDIYDRKGQVCGKIPAQRLHRLWLHSQMTGPLYAALDAIEEGVIGVDSDGFIFYVNRAYMEILQVRGYKVIGHLIQDLEPGSLLTTCLKEHKEIVSQKQKIQSLNVYVSLHILPFFREGRFGGAFSIFKDITEVHHLKKDVDKMTGIVDDYSRKLQNLSVLQDMEIITRDRRFLNVLREAEIAAQTDVPVMICGENGVGKEVVANYIYKCSGRRDQPMITVNCAAIPPDLMESELFGYEEGSFTGAAKGGKKGKFELADKGTIFLDEIGDMPFPMQSKLLRVLQQGEIEKIGRQKRIPVDVRVITATNQPLKEMIEKGHFRRDLYFRINTIPLLIPPLRERPDDLILLAKNFLKEYNEKYKRQFDFSTEGYKKIRHYSWPGNVRELRNYVERSVILGNVRMFPGEEEGADSFEETSYGAPQGAGKSGICGKTRRREAEDKPGGDFCAREHGKESPGGHVQAADPGQEALLEDRLREGAGFDEMVACYEKKLIEEALKACSENRSDAIAMLKMSRRTFFRKCAAYGISQKSDRV